MDAEPAFVDMNVLVYASRTRSPFFDWATAGLRRARDDRSALWFSRQIIREYLAVVTRPQPAEPALLIGDAIADIENLLAELNVAEDGPGVTGLLMQVLAERQTGGKQIHDANIVATMLTHGIKRLLTFNEADFLRFADLIEVIVP